jgi:hypothetical protein
VKDLEKTIVSMVAHKYDAINHTQSIGSVFGISAKKLIEIVFDDFKSGDSIYVLIKKLQDTRAIFKAAFGKDP